MGATILGGSNTAATTTPSLVCTDELDLFESDEVSARKEAVALCQDCPLLMGCRARTRAAIAAGNGPAGLVQGGIAYDYDGNPDPNVHEVYVPPRRQAEIVDEDIDPYAVELVFSDPVRVRDTLTASEREEAFRTAARRGVSLNYLRQALGIHWRVADKTARELGIRDEFETKPKDSVPAVNHDRTVNTDDGIAPGTQLELAEIVLDGSPSNEHKEHALPNPARAVTEAPAVEAAAPAADHTASSLPVSAPGSNDVLDLAMYLHRRAGRLRQRRRRGTPAGILAGHVRDSRPGKSAVARAYSAPAGDTTANTYGRRRRADVTEGQLALFDSRASGTHQLPGWRTPAPSCSAPAVDRSPPGALARRGVSDGPPSRSRSG